jgi:hypothetical protein
MKRLLPLLLLAGCATGPDRSQAETEALAARLMSQYGPVCERSFPKMSEAWGACVRGYYDQERQGQRAQAAAILLANPPPPVVVPSASNAMIQRPQVHCTSYTVGGIVNTTCR